MKRNLIALVITGLVLGTSAAFAEPTLSSDPAIPALRSAPEATSYQGAVQGQMSHSFDQFLPFNP